MPLAGGGVASYPLLRHVATTGGVVIVVILCTNWPTYNYIVRGGASPILYYLLPGFFAAAIALLRPRAAISTMTEPVAWWFAIYVISGLAWFLLSQDFADVALRQWRLRFLGLYFFCVGFLIASVSNRRILALAIVAAVLIGGALNWFDVVFPLRMVPVSVEGANPGRGAGMFINANVAAAFILIATIATLPYIRVRYRAPMLLIAVIAVLPTFSRFGLIFSALLVALAMVVKLLDRVQVALVVLSIPLVIAAAGAYLEVVSGAAGPNANVASRLAWFRTFGEEMDYSARERSVVAQEAWRVFLDSPVYGHGVGATVAKGQRVGTHNTYLQLMAEQGIFGLALYLALIALIASRGWRLVKRAVTPHSADLGRAMLLCCVFLGLYGVVSHNVLEEPHGMLVLGFLMSALRTPVSTRSALTNAPADSAVRSPTRALKIATAGRPTRR